MKSPKPRNGCRPPWRPKKPKHQLRNIVLRCTVTAKELATLGVQRRGHGSALRVKLGLQP